MGLDNFLVSGDVYRRDAVDRTHFPVFHQLEGVRLVDNHELTRMAGLHSTAPTVRLFEDQSAERTPQKQAVHAQEAVDLLEKDLKDCLLGLTRHLFGNGKVFQLFRSVLSNSKSFRYYRVRRMNFQVVLLFSFCHFRH